MTSKIDPMQNMIRLMPFFKILALAYLYTLVNDGGGVKVQINHKFLC